MEELEPLHLTDDERATILGHAAHNADYEILSRRVRLSGNLPAIIERFDALYASFRRGFASDHVIPDTLIRYHVSDSGVFTVMSDHDSYRTAYPEIIQWPSVLFNRIILHRIHTHYLVHAGCVARNGQALAIAGASGMGKTTLVAHLAARGFEFLSDEFAAICRRDGYVDPYAMRLGLRPGPGHDLLGDKSAIDLAFRNDRKKLTDIETLSGREPAHRSELRAVVFLTTDLTSGVTTAQKRGDELKAWFTVWSEALAADLFKMLGATVLAQRPDDDMIEVTLRLRDLTPAVPVMREMARRHGSVLAQIKFEDMGDIDRAATPRLMSIPTSAGVIELIKKIPAFSKAALIEHAFGGKATAMIMELSSRVSHVAFYKLTPGRLEDSLALVERLVP